MSTAPPSSLGAIRLDLEDEGRVAWITLSRPRAADTRNQQMRDELGGVMAWLAQNDDVRAVVLTGEGDRFFCAGMDLKEASSGESPVQRRERLVRSRDIELLAALPQPTIAAINGYALGGGLEMALACDFRIVADHAELGMPEVAAGLMPGAGGTQRLPRLIGYSKAVEMVLLGERIAADEAVAMGLAMLATSTSKLRKEVEDLAARLVALPASSVRRAKESLRQSWELPLSAGVRAELEGLLLLMGDSPRAAHEAPGEA